MQTVLEHCEIFEGLEAGQLARLAAIARRQRLSPGESLFLLGDSADRLYVVLEGRVEVCLPLSFGGTPRDVAVETKQPGGALGWSALVKPYRFTLSARAAGSSEVAAFLRNELQSLLGQDPRLGCAVMGRIAEVVGRRLLTMQALTRGAITVLGGDQIRDLRADPLRGHPVGARQLSRSADRPRGTGFSPACSPPLPQCRYRRRGSP